MTPRCTLARRVAHRALKQRVQTLRSHLRAAAAHDVDGIHDLRVASRRLRAALGDHARVFRKRTLKPFRKRIQNITRGLGIARELDVTLALLKTLRRTAPKATHRAISRAARILRDERAAESGTVAASCALLRSPEFRAEFQELLLSASAPKTCYLIDAEATLRGRYAALAAAYAKWTKRPTDEKLHRVRIAFKKLRYSCEIFREEFGEPLEEFIGHIKNAQELLGDWNDTRMLRDRLVRCSAQCVEMTDAFSELERLCDDDALKLLEQFASSAPGLFDDPNQSVAALFSAPRKKCCDARSTPKER